MEQKPPTIVMPRRKRRWGFLRKLLLLVLIVLLGLAGYSWYRHERDNRTLRQWLLHLNTHEPGWQKQGLQEEHDQLPVSQAFVRALTAFPPSYRGWFGDDLAERPESIPFNMEGTEYTIRLPESYFQILKERLQDTTVSEMRQALGAMLQETGTRRTHFTSMWQIQDLRKIANYLRDEMELAAHEKRWQDLPRLLRLQMQNAQLASHGPDMISKLVSLACMNNSWSGFFRTLALGEMPENILQEIDLILGEIDPTALPHLIRLIRAEHYDTLTLEPNPTLKTELTDFFNRYYSLKTSIPFLPDPVEKAGDRLRVEFMLMNKTGTLLQVLQLHQQALDLLPEHPREVMNLYEGAARQPGQTLTGFLMMSTNKVFRAGISEQMMRDMARVGIACERYRLAQGHWPASLQTLIPRYLKQVPMDPYSGQPILYRLLSDGVVIYSVWMNGIDDGGNVLYLPDISANDRGYRLFNPELRGRRYEMVYPQGKLRE